MGAKVEFPIGKKLFPLVVNPGTSRCPTVDLELVQTTRNVNGTRHSVRKFQPGKRAHLFDFPLFLGIFQWDEPTKRVPFTAEPEIPEILTKWKAPKSSKKCGKKCNVTVKAYCHGERLLVVLRAHSGCISDQTIWNLWKIGSKKWQNGYRGSIEFEI